jgi:tetratricopeptide (TPR) repeat protein
VRGAALAAVIALSGVLALAGATGVAHANGKPWAAGVSAEDQQAALALYEDGNTDFVESRYKEAVPKYERALVHWQHPGIHYNLAVCLLNLDRPVEAYEHLLAALAYGDAPLGKQLYQQGQSYQKLLAGQVGQLELVTEQDGARISLDGKLVLEAPGSASRYVRANTELQVVAEKPGFETETRPIVVPPGDKATLVIELKPLAAQKRMVRRWHPVLPWLVLGLGGAATGTSVLLWMQAREDVEAHNRYIATCPCHETDETLIASLAQRDRAMRGYRLSAGALALGGIGIAAGVWMVIVNQPKLVILPTFEPQPDGGGRAGLVVSGRW